MANLNESKAECAACQPQERAMITAKIRSINDWFLLEIETNLQSSLDNHAPGLESHEGHGAIRLVAYMPSAHDLEAMAQALLDGAAKIREVTQ